MGRKGTHTHMRAHQCTYKHTYIHTDSQTYWMSLTDLTKEVYTLFVNGHLAGLALVSLQEGRGRGGEGKGREGRGRDRRGGDGRGGGKGTEGEERGGEEEGELSLTYHCMSRSKT